MLTEGAVLVMKLREAERLDSVRAKSAILVKVRVAKRAGIWDPIMGPVPMMKRGPGAGVVMMEGCVLRD